MSVCNKPETVNGSSNNRISKAYRCREESPNLNLQRLGSPTFAEDVYLNSGVKTRLINSLVPGSEGVRKEVGVGVRYGPEYPVTLSYTIPACGYIVRQLGKIHAWGSGFSFWHLRLQTQRVLVFWHCRYGTKEPEQAAIVSLYNLMHQRKDCTYIHRHYSEQCGPMHSSGDG